MTRGLEPPGLSPMCERAPVTAAVVHTHPPDYRGHMHNRQTPPPCPGGCRQSSSDCQNAVAANEAPAYSIRFLQLPLLRHTSSAHVMDCLVPSHGEGGL